MKLFKILYLKKWSKPYKTDMYMWKSFFILKKKDKTPKINSKKYKKFEKQLTKYGYVLEPVIVSRESFSSRYVIRNNVEIYHLLASKGFAKIPIKIKNKERNSKYDRIYSVY
ncbi:MAG: hypothetical protein K0Q47_74 [Sedimentibacter sp.]|jgi:hypothetical protein|nr:hypothetical protein [Sedimentibacter sp.]